MITVGRRERNLIGAALMAWCYAAGSAWAQSPGHQSTPASSLADVATRVPIGSIVQVTDNTGSTTKGSLAAVTTEAMQVRERSGMRRVAAADIQRIQWQQPDSPLTGVLIGAAIGAAPGIYWLIADPNECIGMCPEEYAFIGIGAVIGGVIDHLLHKNVTVYIAGRSTSRSNSIAIAPLITGKRKGAQIVVTF